MGVKILKRKNAGRSSASPRDFLCAKVRKEIFCKTGQNNVHGTAFFGGRGLFDGEKTPDFARELAKLKKLDQKRESLFF